MFSEVGYTVISTPAGSAKTLRLLLDTALREQPEFLPHATQYAFGPEGCVATPSIIHHPHMRLIREYCYAFSLPVLQDLMTEFKQDNAEMLIDHIIYRPPGVIPTKHWYTRNTVPHACDGDIILSAFINLSTLSQHFDMIPASHQPGVNNGNGFVSRTLEANEEEKLIRVSVPPGDILLYFDNVIFQTPRTMLHITCALVKFGFRLTNFSDPLNPHILNMLEMQTLVPNHHNILPPVHPRWSNCREKLEQFTLNNLHPAHHMARQCEFGSNRGQMFFITPLVQEPSNSLLTYHGPVFSPYTAEQLKFYVPHKIEIN